MCALQPPFNAGSLHQLAQKIIQGKFTDVPVHFSKNIPGLLSAMLNKDPSKRPNINQILKVPCIADRIKKLLNEQDFKDEFSHTILHNQNVFDEFKAIQAKKKAAEEEQKKQEAAKAEAAVKKQKELESQMAAMKLGDYKPKYGQDKELFNEMYMDYVNRLQQDNGYTSETSGTAVSERPYSQQSSAVSAYGQSIAQSPVDYSDRNDASEQEQEEKSEGGKEIKKIGSSE